MDLSSDDFKKLAETFKLELDEQTQLIIDNLLILEKGAEKDHTKIIESIFRSAHNIKGAARALGVHAVGEIAHHLESLFSSIKNKTQEVNPDIISACCLAVDNMLSAMNSFLEKKPLSFDLPESLKNLDIGKIKIKKFPDKNVKIIEEKKPAKEQDSIRMSLGDINRIYALMEEMQINKIAIDEYYAEFNSLATNINEFYRLWKQTFFFLKSHLDKKISENMQKLYDENVDSLLDITSTTNHLHKNMHTHINRLTILSNSLQEEIRLLRLVPVSSVLRMLPRFARDIATELGKKVELEIKGDEAHMDKLIVEGLKDPLTHLLRNAIDHGIESSEVRIANGKSEVGHISILIKEENNQILIDVTDDGCGISVSKIAETAIKKGLVTKSEISTFNENEILDLIFHPGFSTKDMLTTISGRGVGLDVVKTNISNLKGYVSVNTTPGKGTTIHLCVPLTLISERGLMITSGGQAFVIPRSGIERVLIASTDEIRDVEANQAIIVNGNPVLFRCLSDLLNLEHRELAVKNQLPIIIIKKGCQEVALLVEDIIGEREIVIKPFHPPLINVPCVTGATLSGTGKVIVVLNPSDLIDIALHTNTPSHFLQQEETTKLVSRPTILVVDDSITTRTLEKNILESKDYKVTVAVNGKEAWELLQKQSFSLLITDIMMPIMDGFALTERVKQSDKLHETPVIIISSLHSDAEKRRGIEVGADAYIVKTDFESGALLQIVAQLI